MNKSAVIGTVFGITVATAVAGIVGHSLLDRATGYPRLCSRRQRSRTATRRKSSNPL